MAKTSNKSKQAWNAEHYVQIKVSVNPEIASAFKATCKAAGVSMASTISAFMESYPSIPVKRVSPTIILTTRQHRRKALKQLIGTLEEIRDAEETYRDNIPDNLTNSIVYETAHESVTVMNDAIDILENAYQ